MSPASVSDHGATSKDFTKVEHRQTAFASSNFWTVISPAMFFRFTFFYFGAIIHKAKKNIAELITVEKFELANPVCYTCRYEKILNANER